MFTTFVVEGMYYSVKIFLIAWSRTENSIIHFSRLKMTNNRVRPWKNSELEWENTFEGGSSNRIFIILFFRPDQNQTFKKKHSDLVNFFFEKIFLIRNGVRGQDKKRGHRPFLFIEHENR